MVFCLSSQSYCLYVCCVCVLCLHYPSVYLFAMRLFSLFSPSTFYLFVCLSVYRSVFSLSLSLSVLIHPSVCLSVRVSICHLHPVICRAFMMRVRACACLFSVNICSFTKSITELVVLFFRSSPRETTVARHDGHKLSTLRSQSWSPLVHGLTAWSVSDCASRSPAGSSYVLSEEKSITSAVMVG